ncbi:CLUMA_CG004052, isoform A [Clunio marinus]|uniref:CLUMA_CG004052, isoform A n=1 Tax=Clunio marinus TaxID=568069 RepID=A0A1J1HQQ2_9DIPT|nr:CLUMA_CG004052, isoform A [Clunio marinus]
MKKKKVQRDVIASYGNELCLSIFEESCMSIRIITTLHFFIPMLKCLPRLQTQTAQKKLTKIAEIKNQVDDREEKQFYAIKHSYVPVENE